jgi:type IV pilus assembly protein PilY1
MTKGLPLPNSTLGVSTPTTASDFADVSQPIVLAPVLSTDVSGNLVMHVATGDQDTFAATAFAPGSTTAKVAAYNFLYSVTEKYDSNNSPNKLRANVNWYIPFANGERVTGPMSVFNNGFYFASYAPITASGTSICTQGEGRIWGVDYISHGTCSTGNAQVECIVPLPATPAFPVTSSGYFVPGAADTTVAGQIIPGVVIKVQPPCSAGTSTSDVFAGGSYSQLTMYTPPTPFLTYLTNKITSGSTTTTSAANAVQLAQPKFATGVDSWAAIVE